MHRGLRRDTVACTGYLCPRASPSGAPRNNRGRQPAPRPDFPEESHLSELILLLPVAFGIGLLIGGVGIGGVLLIPALSAFAGLTIHQAMATALFTFLFTGVAGTVMFQRRGSIEWRITVPLCAGAVVFAFLGAWLNSLATPAVLT
ncbi:MAG: sulfite exporter TauE/SafE family protein, partial [Betaproteobacteria bacterium]|nr:sulfite exporter TauE/SafE family protein [Betaproteobacteria bacterium]